MAELFRARGQRFDVSDALVSEPLYSLLFLQQSRFLTCRLVVEYALICEGVCRSTAAEELLVVVVVDVVSSAETTPTRER